jgi:hypothetical protein
VAETSPVHIAKTVSPSIHRNARAVCSVLCRFDLSKQAFVACALVRAAFVKMQASSVFPL